jgi:hypothetical protein
MFNNSDADKCPILSYDIVADDGTELPAGINELILIAESGDFQGKL